MDQTDQPLGQDDKHRSKSRLCLANRKHMVRKFPKAPDFYSCTQSATAHHAAQLNGGDNRQHQPADSQLADQSKQQASSLVVDNSGHDKLVCPNKKKRKPEPPVRRIVCEGRELFELGQNGWTETVKNMWQNTTCEALGQCRASISGSHVSKDALLNPVKPYVPPTFPDSSSEEEGGYSIQDMTTVGEVLKRIVKRGYDGPTADGPVTVTIDKLEGPGKGDVTYTSRNMQVTGPPGGKPFPCRKRVGDQDAMPDEVLNHKYRHSGPCSLSANGVPCYAMIAAISDDSGFTNAQIFAPARHVLGMGPTAFVQISKNEKAEVLGNAVLGKVFRMHLMTCWSREGGQIIKILFVQHNNRVPRAPSWPKDDPDVYDLASSLGSLSVSAVSSVADVSEVQFASPPPTTHEEAGMVVMDPSDVLAVLDQFKTSMQKLLEAQAAIQDEIVEISKFVDGVKESLGL